jgi:hypothetical protein
MGRPLEKSFSNTAALEATMTTNSRTGLTDTQFTSHFAKAGDPVLSYYHLGGLDACMRITKERDGIIGAAMAAKMDYVSAVNLADLAILKAYGPKKLHY